MSGRRRKRASSSASRSTGIRKYGLKAIVAQSLALVLLATGFGASGPSTAQASQSPSARFFHATASHLGTGEVVLFGGAAGGAYANDTWVWNGVTWAEKTPATKPTGRDKATMAYDPLRDEVVLFGGHRSGGVRYNDTWVWDGATWTERTPATKPAVRDAHAMVYDPLRRQVVLFGGYVTGTGKVNDTWVWDGTNWSKKSPATSPPARYYHAMAYDAQRGEVVLFGGYDGTSRLRDTWVWNGTTWSQKSPANMPSARYTHAMADDPARGGVVLYGGHNGTKRIGTTWVWDGSNWSKKLPASHPRRRNGHSMALDPLRGQVMLFGGHDDNNSLGDTWAWTGAQTFSQPEDGVTWVERTPSPSPVPIPTAPPTPTLPPTPTPPPTPTAPPTPPLPPVSSCDSTQELITGGFCATALGIWVQNLVLHWGMDRVAEALEALDTVNDCLQDDGSINSTVCGPVADALDVYEECSSPDVLGCLQEVPGAGDTIHEVVFLLLTKAAEIPVEACDSTPELIDEFAACALAVFSYGVDEAHDGPLPIPVPRCTSIEGHAYCEQVGFFADRGVDDLAEVLAAQIASIGAVMQSASEAQVLSDAVGGTGDMSLLESLLRPNRDELWEAELSSALDGVEFQEEVEEIAVPDVGDLVDDPLSHIFGFGGLGGPGWIWFSWLVGGDPFDPSVRQDQVKSYYCGPATMRAVGIVGGTTQSQSWWADKLNTDAQGASAIGDMVRLTNEHTNLDASGAYALRSIDDITLFYVFHAGRIGLYGGPVLEHSLLRQEFYQRYQMARNHSGHLNFGAGYSSSGVVTDDPEIRIFEVYDERDFVSGGAFTGKAWWLRLEDVFAGNQAHPHRNIGA